MPKFKLTIDAAGAFGDEWDVRPALRPRHEIVEDAYRDETERHVRREDDGLKCKQGPSWLKPQ